MIAKYKNIDRYVHLPIQSGDDKVLKRMNRYYTSKDYKKLVTQIRSKVGESVEIGTDIIVGFPGETENQFQNTVKLARNIGWVVAFIGMYSERPGTVATRNFKDDIPRKEKNRRFHVLNDLINRKKVGVPQN